MTSYQSTFGEGEGMAEELAADQRSISIAEFFEKNRQMLGFDSGARALVTAVKEGVDNSLTWSTPFVYRDAGETKHAPIGDVVDDLMDANRESVEIKRGGDLQKLRVDGFEALSFDEDYAVDFQRVSSVFRHRVNSDIYRITVEGGREVELTDYHSVFVLRDGEITSVETNQITTDDYVVLPDSTWGDWSKHRIDLVDELLDLDPERTESVGIYGVEHLIENYRSEILEQVSADYRISDFRKCDRLPLNIVRTLGLDAEEYADCRIGYQYGRNNIPAVLPVTDKLAELLGLYVAEGCVAGTDHEKVYLSLGSHESALIEYAETLVESVFDVEPSTVAAHETATNVTIPSKIAGLVFEEVFAAGDSASEKRLPRFVLDFSPYKRQRFFIGYAAGDGYPTGEIVPVLRGGGGIERIPAGRVTVATTSEGLASGLRYLLSSVDYDATYEHEPPESRQIDGRTVTFSDSHVLHVRTDQSGTSRTRLPAEHLLESVTDPKLAYNLDERQSRVDVDHALALADGGSVEFANRGRAIAAGDLTALPVTDIETVEYSGEWVYDVSVPGDENFMAGTAPLACHNSLDACEEAGILPDIYVEIDESGDYYRLIVEDNGPGITKEQIPKIFGKLLYGSRFHKREQSLTPDQQILIRKDGQVDCVPISVLCDAYLPSEGAATERIPEGIEAPSFDRETHEMTWEPVTHAIRHETDEQTYRITTEKGRTVEVTGNHSLFSVTKDGETKEVAAGELEAGDVVLTPRELPSFGNTVEEVNLLEYITPEQLDDRRVYVYGFDTETLEQLKEGAKIRKRPSPESDRERTYYRYDGVDILKDSLETNYLEKGYLPAETVLELGWEEKAADCTFRTYQVGGDETTMPVSIPLDESTMRLLGYYICEGHVGDRQVGFTFGSHEAELIEATEQAVAQIGGGTTTVERERNSTRVKAFGSPLSMFLKAACGDSAREKQIPEFVFRASPELQQEFIAALYQGDGSDTHPSNELSHTTTSETLARQLSILWNMQGVLASTEVSSDTKGYGDDPTTKYRTKVYGEDIDLTDTFDERISVGEQQYKRIPVSLLEDVSVGTASSETVPDTIPGLLVGAGVGSSLEHAAEYQSLIEAALDGAYVDRPRYVHNLKEMGLLDEDHRPTEQLRELWDTIHNLHGLTDSDMCLLSVTDVEQTDPPEYVYDISVPGATGYDENFVVVNEGALSVKNSRGQQGIGISAAVLYSQLTSGKPAKITSRPHGRDEAKRFEIAIDTDSNEPEIESEDTTSWDRPHGTRIELEMEGNMRARQSLHDYIKHTAVVNPHARIELREPDDHFKYERATDQLPEETEEIRPHPHGVELGTLQKMLEATDSYSVSGFLQGEFTRVGGKTAQNVIDNFRDRHFGREMTWRPPESHEDADIEAAVTEAVVNKGAEATADFAERVADDLESRDRIAHSEVVAVVDEMADEIETAYDKSFGDTVRENAVEAAWNEITAERTADIYTLVDEATTKRKDDAHVQGLAERIAAKFENRDDDPRDRVPYDDLHDYVAKSADDTEEFDGATFGETARENVTDAIWDVMETVPDDTPNVSAIEADRDTASELLDAMRSADIIAPPTDCLSPITADLVEAGLKKEFDADFYSSTTRDASVHGGDPFIVEVGIAYGGELDEGSKAQVMRFANRVPLVYQRGACAITDVIKDINWRNYKLDQPGGSGIPNGPAVIMVHVASTNVPFTSESKDAVANIPEIEDEIERAIRESARDLKSFLKKRRSMEKRRRKQDKLATILPAMAEKLEEVTGRGELDIDDSLARIMNNVLVDRERDDETVRLVVENNSSTNADLEVTDILSVDPGDVEEANVVEMDGEYFVKWSPTVKSGEEASIEYEVNGDVEFSSPEVDGVEAEKLTVNA